MLPKEESKRCEQRQDLNKFQDAVVFCGIREKYLIK
jgi:hypothetical protein